MPLAQNCRQKELGRQLPFISSPFVPLLGLHPRTRKLDSFHCLCALTRESIKRQGMFCSVTRLCSLQLKQALKNARGNWSAGHGQQSSCVTERIRGPFEDLAGMINGGQHFLGSRRHALSKVFYRFHRGPLCSPSSFSYDEIEFERFLPTTLWIWMPGILSG